jgi:hypothetical protein
VVREHSRSKVDAVKVVVDDFFGKAPPAFGCSDISARGRGTPRRTSHHRSSLRHEGCRHSETSP